MQRRQFLKSSAGATLGIAARAALAEVNAEETNYYSFGRTEGYKDFSIIEPGRRIVRVETFTKGSFGFVRLATDDGREGLGQISTYHPDIAATVLHRQIAPHVLGQDPAHIDAINDRCIDANLKFPWSYVCRALGGVDTALWDLYGKIREKSVCQLLGAEPEPLPVYGSSMRRDIAPADEAARLMLLQAEYGFDAFKVRVGSTAGHNRDASPGRTEALIPLIRQAVGEDAALLVDGNSCYTPDRAIEVGRLLEEHDYCHFEEPCPYWELEWTAEVAEALDIDVAGGEQDNDLAQWRRMIRMNAVDVVQPDPCYVGGFTRALRVAQLAEQAHKPVVPHSANLSLVTIFAMHLMAAAANAGPYVEYSIEWSGGVSGKCAEVYQPQLTIQDGKVAFPPEPGWGVTLLPAWLESADHRKTEW